MLAVIREFAPLVCAIVMAGVAGTAMCADLGARKIREELDALMVLGVDPVKNLVVPRFLSLMLVTALFDIYAVIFGTLGGVLATLVNGAPLGPFLATYFNNATTVELLGSLVKTTVFGGDHRDRLLLQGHDRLGRRPEGVGRAVNQAVVIAFLGLGAFNYVFTQAMLALVPELTDDPMSAPGRDLGLPDRPHDLVLRPHDRRASTPAGCCASSARRCARRGS